MPPRHLVHHQARQRLVFATNPDLKKIGFALEDLGKHRATASYDLRPLSLFSSAKDARDEVQHAAAALALLDSIDADPVRRGAAIASIKP